MITELTPISELCFSMTDDVPRAAMKYAGCDLLVVDDAGDVWYLHAERDAEVWACHPGTRDAGTIAAIMRGAKGFIAIRA